MRKYNLKNLATLCLLLFPLIAFCQDAPKDSVELLNVDEIFTVVTSMPHLGNDNENLQPFIQKQSQFPVSLKRTESSKNVFVQVIIERDGSVVFTKIVKGAGKKLDAEAKRIVENMPKWTPGLNSNGLPVRVRLMFPIWFD